MSKQTAIRLNEELLHIATTVCRVEQISMNALVQKSLEEYISKMKADPEFKRRAKALLDVDIQSLQSLI